MKIRPVRSELFHVEGQWDGRTDRRDEPNLTFALTNLAKAPITDAPNRNIVRIVSCLTLLKPSGNFTYHQA
jgi:hypothetical protein